MRPLPQSRSKLRVFPDRDTLRHLAGQSLERQRRQRTIRRGWRRVPRSVFDLPTVTAFVHEWPRPEPLKVSIHPWPLEGSNEFVSGAPLGALRSATWHRPALGLARPKTATNNRRNRESE